MSVKRYLVLTRSNSFKNLFGSPCRLDKTEPSTLPQIIQFSYFLKNIYSHLKNFEIIQIDCDGNNQYLASNERTIGLVKGILYRAEGEYTLFQKGRTN